MLTGREERGRQAFSSRSAVTARRLMAAAWLSLLLAVALLVVALWRSPACQRAAAGWSSFSWWAAQCVAEVLDVRSLGAWALWLLVS